VGEWPAAAIISSQPPRKLDPFPAWYDANAVLMSADADNVYLAYNLTGHAPFSSLCNTSNDEYVLASINFRTLIDVTDGATVTRLAITFHIDTQYYKYVHIFNYDNYQSLMLPLTCTPDGNAIEIAIPRESLGEIGVEIGPGSNITHVETRATFAVSDRLNNPRLKGLTTYVLIVDPEAGTIRQEGHYTGISKAYSSVTGTYPINLSYYDPNLDVNVTLSSPSASGQIIVLLGIGDSFMAPAEPPRGRPYIFVYFRLDLLNDASSVTWPLTLEITLPEEAEIDGVYYYNKHANTYLELPGDLYQINETRITIQYTQELYEQGDPGILITLQAATVSGELHTQTPSVHPALPLLAASLTALLYLAISRRARRTP